MSDVPAWFKKVNSESTALNEELDKVSSLDVSKADTGETETVKDPSPSNDSSANPIENKQESFTGLPSDLLADEDIKSLKAQLEVQDKELQRRRSEDGRTKKLFDENQQLKSQLAQKTDSEVKDENFTQNQFNHLTEEEKSDIDPLVLKGMENQGSEIQMLRAQLADATAKIDNMSVAGQRQQVRASYLAEVSRVIPNMARLCQEPSFKAWCATANPTDRDGKPYGRCIQEADHDCNARFLIGLIETYKNETSGGRNRINLGVRPNTISSSQNSQTKSSDPNMNTYSLAVINSFMDQYTRGKLNLNDKSVIEKMRIYKAALDDGRVE